MNEWMPTPCICCFAKTNKTTHCRNCLHSFEHEFTHGCLVACPYNKEHDEHCLTIQVIHITEEKILE